MGERHNCGNYTDSNYRNGMESVLQYGNVVVVRGSSWQFTADEKVLGINEIKYSNYHSHSILAMIHDGNS